MSHLNLSIIIPGYNEEAGIAENLKKVHATAQGLDIAFEIIFVNDGSTDNTEAVVSRLCQKMKELQLISYPTNRGRGYAMRHGIEQARGEFVLTVESDLNYGDLIIRDLYESIVHSLDDIVVASPYMKGGGTKNLPFKRLFLSKWGNKILSASIGGVVHTISGMTRIYRRECIQSLLLTSEDKEIHLEILSKALASGYQIAEIPATLTWPDRKVRKTGTRRSAFSAMKYINSHIIFTLFERPILFFGFLGVGIFLLSLLLGFYIIYLRYAGGLNPNRPLMVLLVIMMLGGFIMISFGLLGMQINNLRKEIYRIQSRIKK